MVDRNQTSFEAGARQLVGTRVFLSYSRKDGPFTNHLATELLSRGYAPDFDQSAFDPLNIESGISAQDEWWRRLQQMIEAADVIVFVVSPDSAASKVCDEEIAHARDLGKRIIPILCRPVDFATAPPKLAALNVKISFAENGTPAFSTALDRLCAELDLDVGWHRESRRLLQLAVKWDAEGRSAEQLMNAADIAASERIVKNRPRTADPPGPLLVDFLHASRAAQEERLRREQEQIERARRFQNKASSASNNLVGGLVEQFQEREGVPLALTVGILETAVHFLDGLSDGRISDPRMEREYGLALAQLSEKKRLLNDFDQAERAAQRAVAIFERLGKSYPENTQYSDDLHAALDRLIDASDPEIALGAAHRALDLAKVLVEKAPTLERRLHYSISLSKYAYLIGSSNNAGAIAMYTAALRIQEDILRDNESLEYVRRAAALTRLNVGQLHCESLEFSKAQAWVLASLSEIGRLKANHPRNITYTQDEAAAREVLGDIFKFQSKMGEAVVEYRESLALSERLSDADNSNIELRLTLLRAYDRVAGAVTRLGYPDEAIEVYTKGLRVALQLGRTSPERSDWRGTRSLLESLSMALIKRNEAEVACKYVSETAELLRELVSGNIELQDELAKVLGFQSYVVQFTKNFPAAIHASAEATALSPTNWRIGVNRIHALLRAEDVSEAVRYFREIRGSDSEGGRKIAREIENDLDAFKAAHLPQDFLLTLDKFVKSAQDELCSEAGPEGRSADGR